ncbi:hypothetical protein BROUX41_005782 [Berkeleyomyces rouxiae]|uniref:uncharacterized protein n=1 Tax=Berkeleyomyces rouxiae TaxID=2035830 RepID=UPI003B77BC15
MTEQSRRPARLGHSSHLSPASNRLPAARLPSASRSVSSPIALLGSASADFRSPPSPPQSSLHSAPRRSSSASTISLTNRATNNNNSLKPTIASLARGSGFAAHTKSTSARLSASSSSSSGSLACSASLISPSAPASAPTKSAAAGRRRTTDSSSSVAPTPSVVILRPITTSSTVSSLSNRSSRRSTGTNLALDKDQQHVPQPLKRGAKSTLSVTSRASTSAVSVRRTSLNLTDSSSPPTASTSRSSRSTPQYPASSTATSRTAANAASKPPPKRPPLKILPATMPVIKAMGSASATGGPNPSSATSTRSSFTPKIAGKPGRLGAAVAPMTAKNRSSLTTTGSTVSSPPIYDHHPQINAGGPKLTSNVTPRSGSRQNRVDSSSTTPTAPLTPSFERLEHLEADSLRRQAVSFNSSPATPKDDPDAKFFYASDVNAKLPSAPRLAPPPKQKGFFYANGGAVEPSAPKSSAPPSASLLKSPSQASDDLSSKFFYANGAPEAEPSHRSSISSSSASTTSRSMVSRLSTSGLPSSPSLVASQRPLSPKKNSVNGPPLKPTQANSPVAPHKPIIQTRPVSTSNPPPYLPANGPASQRSSMDAHQMRSHARSGSSFSQSDLTGSPAGTPSQRPLSISSNDPLPSPPLINPAMNLASILQAAEEFEDSQNDQDVDDDDNDDDSNVSGSDLDSDSEADEPVAVVSDSVINARSQRKVQDLEIRNASLEAINRTLERQLRKQQSELRRFRRLTRGGRLGTSPAGPEAQSNDASLLSDTAEEEECDDTLLPGDKEMKSNSTHDALGSGEDVDGSDMDAESENDDDDGSLSSSSSSNDTPLSPNTQEVKDVRRRNRDERRLHLDLSKHRELLVDSQKINQSLKRCLNWTEELIREGRKALVYQVHVPDTKVGGRVLDPLDMETDDEDGVREYPVFYPRTGAVSPSATESVMDTDDDEDENSGEDTETEADTPVATARENER